MPFTLAHPGAVVFIKNKHLNLNGLILGAMAPDFMYFLLFSPSSHFGHTLLGALILNMPLCFLLNYIYCKYVKEAFILNLPRKISRNYSFFIENHRNKTTLREAFIFAYSSILGMVTHAFWDAFTHDTGYFVTRLNFLTNSIDLLGHQIYIYKIAQHGSTLLGFTVILLFLYKMRKESPCINIPIRNKQIYHAIAMCIGFFVMGLSLIIFKDNFGIGRLVVTTINGLFLGYIVSSVNFMRKKAIHKVSSTLQRKTIS